MTVTRQLGNRSVYVIYIVLALTTLAVFSRTLGHGFVNLDDNLYVYENSHVKVGLTLSNLAWAFKTTDQCFWHPLVWLSYFLDRQVWGLQPLGFHVTNLVLHVANVLLLFHILRAMTGSVRKSAFVAGLFGVHPLHLESVAWVSERKDVLSTLFWFLTLWAYTRFATADANPSKFRIRQYAIVVVFFVLGLMAKPMLVTVPLVLLLLDYWPLGRISAGASVRSRSEKNSACCHPNGTRLILEKVPLLALSIIFSGIAYYAQKAGNAISLSAYPFSVRLGNALCSYVSYIAKAVWPRELAVFYPHAGLSLEVWRVACAALFLAVISFGIWAWRRYPYLTVGWLWYVVTLIPVIGFVQVGSFAMADRYTYVPLIGLFIALSWGATDLLKRICPGKTADFTLSAVGLVILLAFGVCTFVQSGYWKDSVTLFTRALSVTSENALAHNNLGTALEDAGEVARARAHYLRANQIQPNYAQAYSNLGSLLAQQGRRSEAIRYLSHAIRLDPGYWKARYNLAVMLQNEGALSRAISQYREVLKTKPDFPQAHANLGAALLVLGRHKEALSELHEALRLAPDLEEARFNLVVALYQSGDYAGTWSAVRECEKRGIPLPPAFVSELKRKMPRRD